MIQFILLVPFYSPDSPTLYRIKSTYDFFKKFSSIEEWSLSEDYSNYVEELEFNGVVELPGKFAYHVIEA